MGYTILWVRLRRLFAAIPSVGEESGPSGKRREFRIVETEGQPCEAAIVARMKTLATVVIDAERAESNYWRDLWRYRELLAFLAWRDLLVRYKQTVIGIAWAVLRPLLTMIVFTIVFGKFAQLPSDGSAPYALMVFAAMLPWQFFSTAFAETSNSLISNTAMITKVYFPRIIIPISTVMVALVDLLISAVMLSGLMAWYGYAPDLLRLLSLPAYIFLVFCTATGAGLWMAALNVKYRDFRYVVPFLIQVGLFASPVGFSSAILPESWRLLYSLNPLVGIIDGFRWAVLGTAAPLYWPATLIAVVVSAALLGTGVIYFRRTERTFADVI